MRPDYQLKRYRGVWCIYWREGGQPKRHSLRTTDEAVAKRAFADQMLLLERPSDMTIRSIWEAYCKEKEARPIIRTMRSEWVRMSPHFGDYRPDQVTRELVKDYIEKRRAQGIKDGTLWTELGHLRTVLNWAVDEEWIKKAPRIDRPSKPPPRDRWLTKAEAHKLISACVSPHMRLFVILMISTAARPTAALDLTWDRVDFEFGVIQLALPGEEGRKGRATVPMSNTLRAALQSARATALSDHVIEYHGGRVLSVKRAFQAAAARAGLESVTPHVLRHTAAVWMVSSGVSMEKVSQYLGHRDSIITSRVYARFAPEHMADAAAAVELNFLETCSSEPESVPQIRAKAI